MEFLRFFFCFFKFMVTKPVALACLPRKAQSLNGEWFIKIDNMSSLQFLDDDRRASATAVANAGESLLPLL